MDIQKEPLEETTKVKTEVANIAVLNQLLEKTKKLKIEVICFDANTAELSKILKLKNIRSTDKQPLKDSSDQRIKDFLETTKEIRGLLAENITPLGKLREEQKYRLRDALNR